MRTLSRRALLGGGAVAASGTAALAVGQTTRGRRWLHQVGLVDGPDRAPPDVRADVERETLASEQMGRDVPWAMYVPDERPTAVVLCMHGRNSSHAFAFDAMGVHRFVAAAGDPWAVVAVDGGDASYWHPRADGTDSSRMVFDELLPVVRDRIGPTPLLLLGWSMGGYGALLAASQRPDEVVAVAASSPAIWRSFEDAQAGAFDDAADFERNDLFRRVEQLRLVPVQVDCGRDDPFVTNVRALAHELPDAERRFPDGFHEAATWRSFLPDQLAFFRRATAQ